jgi:exosome complex RNA-binding protein Rrp42 (RNase PH superfamily)
VLTTLYGNIIDRAELAIFKGEFAWTLNVDILVMDELALHQIDQIALAVRAAFLDLALPQVIATLNSNTNKIEVGLVEEVYPDKDNTDQLVVLKSAKVAPFLVSIGIIRDEVDGDLIVLDCDETEVQCVDQILHVAVDS